MRIFTKNIWNILTGRQCNATYAEAVASCLRIENAIQSINANFQEVASQDFNIVKNRWTDLPLKVSRGVSTMGLHLSDEYRSVLKRFIHCTSRTFSRMGSN